MVSIVERCPEGMELSDYFKLLLQQINYTKVRDIDGSYYGFLWMTDPFPVENYKTRELLLLEHLHYQGEW